MRVDTGLQDGVGALRQDDQLLDLTLKVDGQEFRVHKVVLASVSDYFHAMLCGSLKESKSDIVELKEVSAEQVSRLLDFIYTGDNSVIKSYPTEMLACGAYFQMPNIIKECRQILMSTLTVTKCLDLLRTFLKFPVDDTTQVIIDYIKTNLKKVMVHYNLKTLIPEVIPVILNNWKKSDWDLFQYLTSWYRADRNNRKIYMDDFMSQVRFKLITPDQISAVKEGQVYAECDGSWKVLVGKAAAYHQLPIHQKVLDKSVQNHVRSVKSVFVMNTSKVSYDSSKTYVLCKDAYKQNCWKRFDDAQPPQDAGRYPFVLEVNNFLVTCSEFGNSQHWQVFDPRTLTWYKMANMPKPRDAFAVVHHGKHLYVLGGCERETPVRNSQTKTIQEYSFKTNTWSSTKKLPVPVHSHAACVFQDAIYVSGGEVEHTYGTCQTDRVDCFSLSSQTWESKAALLKPSANHKMAVMKINNNESIAVIGSDLKIDYYDRVTDQWSKVKAYVHTQYEGYCDNSDRSVKSLIGDLRLASESMMFVTGNTVFLLNVCGRVLPTDINTYNGKNDTTSNKLCAKWTIPEDPQRRTVEFPMRDFPFKRRLYQIDAICNALAFPAKSATALTHSTW